MSIVQALSGIEWKPLIGLEELKKLQPREKIEYPSEEDLKRILEPVFKPTRDPDILKPVSEEEPGTRKEGIIIDPLAFYVPYHYYPRDWGIYFRIHKILADFSKLLAKYAKIILSPYFQMLIPRRPRFIKGMDPLLFQVFRVYLSVIFIHEFQHHIIEDASTIGNKSYPYVSNIIDEEGFCEFYAFSAVNAGVLLSAATLVWFFEYGIVVPVIPRLKRKFLEHVLSILYYHWNRETNLVYKPRITPNMAKVLQNSPEWFLSETLNVAQHTAPKVKLMTSLPFQTKTMQGIWNTFASKVTPHNPYFEYLLETLRHRVFFTHY